MNGFDSLAFIEATESELFLMYAFAGVCTRRSLSRPLHSSEDFVKNAKNIAVFVISHFRVTIKLCSKLCFHDAYCIGFVKRGKCLVDFLNRRKRAMFSLEQKEPGHQSEKSKRGRCICSRVVSACDWQWEGRGFDPGPQPFARVVCRGVRRVLYSLAGGITLWYMGMCKRCAMNVE